MKRAFLFAYSESLGTYEQVHAFVNECKLITTWRHELSSAFFIISENTPSEICAQIREKFGRKGTYLITEIGSDSEGLLSARSWQVLANKQLPPKDKPVPKLPDNSQ